jgi:hypothetical protein
MHRPQIPTILTFTTHTIIHLSLQFQHERERRRKFDSSSSSANRKELRVLHSHLRPSRSTFQLTSRWNADEQVPISSTAESSPRPMSSRVRGVSCEDELYSYGLPLSHEDTSYLTNIAEVYEQTQHRASSSSSSSTQKAVDRQLLSSSKSKLRKRCSSYNEVHLRNIEHLYANAKDDSDPASAGDTSEEEAYSSGDGGRPPLAKPHTATLTAKPIKAKRLGSNGSSGSSRCGRRTTPMRVSPSRPPTESPVSLVSPV